jgi:hypothetical protein
VLQLLLVLTTAMSVSSTSPTATVSRQLPVVSSTDGAGGPDAYGYRWLDNDTTAPGTPVYRWESRVRTNGTQIAGLADDNVVGPFNIGFNFPYYWYTVPSVYVGSNGYIAFGDNTLEASPFANLPYSGRPNNVVAPLMSDLDFTPPGTPAKAFYWTNAALDTFIVEYDSVSFWSTGGTNSFQIVLSRRDSAITFMYQKQVGAPYNGWADSTATVGIENITGTVGLSYLFGRTPSRDSIHDLLAVRFIPPPTSSMTVHDMATWRVMNEQNGGVFLLNNTAARFWAKIKNVGNQNETSVPVYCILRNRLNAVVFADTATIASTTPGRVDSIAFARSWTPTTEDVFTLRVITNLTGDMFRKNDTIPLETRVVTYPTTLRYDRDTATHFYYWNGASGGYGNRFVAPSYPVQVTGIKAYLSSGTTVGCTLWLMSADGPGGGPGTVQARGLISNVQTQGWYQLDLSAPVLINSGAFFVGVTSDANQAPSYGMDSVLPISRQTWEYTGSWAPSRDLESRDAMMCALVRLPLATDLGVDAIRSPTVVINPSAVTPVVRVKNFGTSAQSSIPVHCWIDSAGTRIYNQTDTIPGPLAAYDTIHVSFPNWTTGSLGNQYLMTAFTDMTGDQYRNNDTAKTTVTTFLVSETLAAPWASTTPTLDGNIASGEWSDAVRWDISDVAGEGGIVYAPNSAILYCKHDSDYVYYAMDLPPATTRDNLDQFGPYVDENYDRAWSADSSEGNHWMIFNVRDTAAYRAIPSYWTTYAPGVATSRSSLTSGHLQFEARVHKGAAKWDYNINPGGATVGLYVYASDNPGTKHLGHWPTLMPSASWNNAAAYGTLILVVKFVPDAGCVGIAAPIGAHDTSVQILPQARVKNYGIAATTFTATFDIFDAGHASVYSNTATFTLPAGGEDLHTFAEWAKPHAVGAYTTRCSTFCAQDTTPGNNVKTSAFSISTAPPGWVQKADVPAGFKNKKVKDGGSLAYNPEPESAYGNVGYIYAFKGNNRCEFYKYNTASNTWAAKESIPIIGSTGKKKAVKKGASLAQAEGKIYATKGNNNVEYWRYTPSADAYPWQEMAPVPTGAKNCKEGVGQATVTLGDTTFVYLLKGSGTQEFYRYCPWTNVWASMAPAPLGASNKLWKKGSALTTGGDLTDGIPTIYALKGGYNEFFLYNCSTNTWITKNPLPLVGTSGKKKKAGDGAGIAWVNGRVYALKGNNTQEFWMYTAATDTWKQAEDFPLGPSGKKPKGGGALEYAPAALDQPPALFALKGNNTLEFYDYPVTDFLAAIPPANANSMLASTAPITEYRLLVAPNPFNRVATISYSLPKAGSASLRVYGVTGALVSTLSKGYTEAGNYTATIDATKLARGIYILKFESAGYNTTRKLVLE